MALAPDCLVAALDTCVDGRRPRPIPAPSRPEPEERLIALPPLMAAKLALHQALREQGLSASELAARLGMADTAIRRLLDLNHRSHIAAVEAALAHLGRRVELAVEAG